MADSDYARNRASQASAEKNFATIFQHLVFNTLYCKKGISLPWLPETRPRALVGLIVFWCILFTLTHIPGDRLPKIPFTIRDLLAHFFAFLILTILYMSAFPRRHKFITSISGFRCSQSWSSMQVWMNYYKFQCQDGHGSLHDFLADVCGVILAIIAVEGFRWIFVAVRNSTGKTLG